MNSNVNIRYSIHMTMISFSRNSRSFIFIGSISKNFLVNFFVLWFDKYRKEYRRIKESKKYASFLISAALQRKKKRLYVHIPHLHQTVPKKHRTIRSWCWTTSKNSGAIIPPEYFATRASGQHLSLRRRTRHSVPISCGSMHVL